MILATHRRFRLTEFFVLYALQGLIAGYSMTALLNAFAASGVSVGELGKFGAIIGIPWVLQFFWGPVVDLLPNFAMGRRRFWVVVSLIASNLVLFGLFFVQPRAENLYLIAGIFFCHSVFASLLDVAADGLIVDQVPSSEAGLVSAMTRGGFVSGTCLSGALFSWTLTHWGHQATIASLLAASLLASVIPFLGRESTSDSWLSLKLHAGEEFERRQKRKKSPRLFARVLWLRMRQWNAGLLLLISFLLNFGFGAFALHYNADVVQNRGWTDLELSRLQSIAGFVTGTVGSFAIGWLCDKLDFRRILGGLMFLSALMFAAYATVSTPSHAMMWWMVVFLILAPGLFFVAIVPAVMAMSRGVLAATIFTLFMTCMNLGSIVGGTYAEAIFKALDIREVSMIGALSLVLLTGLTSLLAHRTYGARQAPDSHESQPQLVTELKRA